MRNWRWSARKTRASISRKRPNKTQGRNGQNGNGPGAIPGRFISLSFGSIEEVEHVEAAALTPAAILVGVVAAAFAALTVFPALAILAAFAVALLRRALLVALLRGLLV